MANSRQRRNFRRGKGYPGDIPLLGNPREFIPPVWGSVKTPMAAANVNKGRLAYIKGNASKRVNAAKSRNRTRVGNKPLALPAYRTPEMSTGFSMSNGTRTLRGPAVKSGSPRRSVGRVIDDTRIGKSARRGMNLSGVRQATKSVNSVAAKTEVKAARQAARSTKNINKLSPRGRTGLMIGTAVTGAAAFAAYRATQRGARDLNQTLGNPASNVTAWTTYNRTNRGY